LTRSILLFYDRITIRLDCIREGIKLNTVATISVSKQGLHDPAQRLLSRRQPAMQIFYSRQRGHRVNMTFNMETIGRQHHTHHFL